MDKLAKSIVKALHSENPMEDITCAYTGSFDYLATFTISELASRVGAPETNTRLAIKYLQEIGYVEPVYYGSSSANKKVGGVRLSHRGKRCREIAMENFCKTVFNGVILPVAVSFITTLATSSLELSWRQIAQLFSNIL